MKKKHFLCLLLISFYHIISFAQELSDIPTVFSDYPRNKNLDSLESYALNQKKNPKKYLHALITLELNRYGYSNNFGTYLEEIKVLAAEQSDKLGIAMYNSLLIYTYWKQDFAKATQMCINALHYFEEQKDYAGMIDCYYNLIAINVNNNAIYEKEKVVNYYNKALEVLDKNSNVPTKILGATLIINFNQIIFQSNDITRELNAYHEIKTLIANNPRYNYAKHSLLINMGMLMIRIHRYEQALDYLLEDAQEITPNDDYKIITYTNLGICYLKLKQYKLSRLYNQKAIDLINKYQMEWPENLADLYENLAVASFYQKEYNSAWKYRSIADSLKINLQQKSNAKEAFEIQTKYEADKKALENKALYLEMEKKNQKITFLVLLTFLLTLATLLGLWFNQKKIQKNKELDTLNEKISQQNEKLSKTNQQLEYFVYSLSHDAIGYINHILNYCTMGKQSIELDDSLKFLETIYEKAKNLKNMAQSLIKYHQMNQNNIFVSINLSTIVQEVINELGFFEKDNRIVVTIKPLPIINSDIQLLKQVFRNLLSNCVQYRKPDTSLLIEISAEKVANQLKIDIKDNGIGIEEELIPFIFEKFVRGKSLAEGSGLGLNICRQIVQNLGGTITVESNLGVGSTFSFLLPLRK